jgi:hypothetical protein
METAVVRKTSAAAHKTIEMSIRDFDKKEKRKEKKEWNERKRSEESRKKERKRGERGMYE